MRECGRPARRSVWLIFCAFQGSIRALRLVQHHSAAVTASTESCQFADTGSSHVDTRSHDRSEDPRQSDSIG